MNESKPVHVEISKRKDVNYAKKTKLRGKNSMNPRKTTVNRYI